jgi:hypothetical protein
MTQPALESDRMSRFLVSSTWLNILLAMQLVAGLVYAYITGDMGSRWTHFVLPFIWFTASVWVIWHTRPETTRRVYRLGAALVVALYLIVMFYFSGLLGPSTSHFGQLTGPSGFGMTWGRSLGWSPVFVYTGDLITVSLIPYQAVGLFALAYLVYDALLDLSQSAIGGIVGIVACPACVSPLFAVLLAGGLSGSSTMLLLGAYGYEIATVLFLVAVGILYHRQVLTRQYHQFRIN